MDKMNNVLDGNLEEQTKALKEFFGLSPNQSFHDLKVDEGENEEDNKN